MESLAPPLPRMRLASPAIALHPATAVTAAACAFAAVAFAWLGIARYETFNSTAFDLGFFDQVVWQISRGHPGVTSYLYYYDFFGQHLELVLYGFAALYRLWADPRLLLTAQALSVGLAAGFLFAAARQVLAPWPSAAISLAFLTVEPQRGYGRACQAGIR